MPPADPPDDAAPGTVAAAVTAARTIIAAHDAVAPEPAPEVYDAIARRLAAHQTGPEEG